MDNIKEISRKEVDTILKYLDNEYKNICNMRWGRKKYKSMQKIFKLVKYNDSVPEDIRERIVKNLYCEIQKQAEEKRHSKKYLLSLIIDYEDIFDLVEVFLE